MIQVTNCNDFTKTYVNTTRMCHKSSDHLCSYEWVCNKDWAYKFKEKYS